MPEKGHTAVGIGELLWDVFPTGKQLGGAPANFAYICNPLGNRGIPASGAGTDKLGEEALAWLEQLGLTAEFVQRDDIHPTGAVRVQVDDQGQPAFQIAENVAWDCLEWTAAWQQLAVDADAICFGTLAQRSSQSQRTIRSFLQAARHNAIRIFDVNLRQNFYSVEIIAESMRLAKVVKLNHEELPIVMRLLGCSHRRAVDSARRLLAEFDLNLVCVTRGNSGSILISASECNEHSGFKVKVADTVGAGDAFTAGLAHGLLRGRPLAEVNDLANRCGAWVASQRGAMPAAPAKGLRQRLAEL